MRYRVLSVFIVDRITTNLTTKNGALKVDIPTNIIEIEITKIDGKKYKLKLSK